MVVDRLVTHCDPSLAECYRCYQIPQSKTQNRQLEYYERNSVRKALFLSKHIIILFVIFQFPIVNDFSRLSLLSKDTSDFCVQKISFQNQDHWTLNSPSLTVQRWSRFHIKRLDSAHTNTHTHTHTLQCTSGMHNDSALSMLNVSWQKEKDMSVFLTFNKETQSEKEAETFPEDPKWSFCHTCQRRANFYQP